MTQFNKINKLVCFYCLQVQSVLIFLPFIYLVIKITCDIRASTGKNLVLLNLGVGGGESRPTAWVGGDGVGYRGGGGAKCAGCMT
jgi:hypothetical protein